jgi:hypothetical protein
MHHGGMLVFDLTVSCYAVSPPNKDQKCFALQEGDIPARSGQVSSSASGHTHRLSAETFKKHPVPSTQVFQCRSSHLHHNVRRCSRWCPADTSSGHLQGAQRESQHVQDSRQSSRPFDPVSTVLTDWLSRLSRWLVHAHARLHSRRKNFGGRFCVVHDLNMHNFFFSEPQVDICRCNRHRFHHDAPVATPSIGFSMRR